MAFWTVHQTVQNSKVNNGCDKPCASCTTLHFRDIYGLRRVILVCEMSSQTSLVSRHNCIMVSGHVTLSGNQWGPSPIADGTPDGGFAGQALLLSNQISLIHGSRIKIKIILLSTISPLQLPNFVSCGRNKPSHKTQNFFTVGAKLWTAERFLVDPWSVDQADLIW